MKKIDKNYLITPNLPEIEILTGIKILKKDMIVAANELIKLGAPNDLIKGGHLKSKKYMTYLLAEMKLKLFKQKSKY